MIESSKTHLAGIYLMAALLMLCAVSLFAGSQPLSHRQQSRLATNQVHCEREVTARGIAECIDRFEAARWGSNDLRVRPG